MSSKNSHERNPGDPVSPRERDAKKTKTGDDVTSVNAAGPVDKELVLDTRNSGGAGTESLFTDTRTIRPSTRHTRVPPSNAGTGMGGALVETPVRADDPPRRGSRFGNVAHIPNDVSFEGYFEQVDSIILKARAAQALRIKENRGANTGKKDKKADKREEGRAGGEEADKGGAGAGEGGNPPPATASPFSFAAISSIFSGLALPSIRNPLAGLTLPSISNPFSRLALLRVPSPGGAGAGPDASGGAGPDALGAAGAGGEAPPATSFFARIFPAGTLAKLQTHHMMLIYVSLVLMIIGASVGFLGLPWWLEFGFYLVGCGCVATALYSMDEKAPFSYVRTLARVAWIIILTMVAGRILLHFLPWWVLLVGVIVLKVLFFTGVILEGYRAQLFTYLGTQWTAFKLKVSVWWAYTLEKLQQGCYYLGMAVMIGLGVAFVASVLTLVMEVSMTHAALMVVGFCGLLLVAGAVYWAWEKISLFIMENLHEKPAVMVPGVYPVVSCMSPWALLFFSLGLLFCIMFPIMLLVEVPYYVSETTGSVGMALLALSFVPCIRHATTIQVSHRSEEVDLTSGIVLNFDSEVSVTALLTWVVQEIFMVSISFFFFKEAHDNSAVEQFLWFVLCMCMQQILCQLMYFALRLFMGGCKIVLSNGRKFYGLLDCLVPNRWYCNVVCYRTLVKAVFFLVRVTIFYVDFQGYAYNWSNLRSVETDPRETEVVFVCNMELMSLTYVFWGYVLLHLGSLLCMSSDNWICTLVLYVLHLELSRSDKILCTSVHTPSFLFMDARVLYTIGNETMRVPMASILQDNLVTRACTKKGKGIILASAAPASNMLATLVYFAYVQILQFNVVAFAVMGAVIAGGYFVWTQVTHWMGSLNRAKIHFLLEAPPCA